MAFTMVLTTSCDPMEDIHDEIDFKENVIVGDDVITLTDDDYDELDLDGGFASVDEVKLLLPNYLSDLYPVWGKGSSVLVNYNMTGGLTDLAEVSDYMNAENYSLETADYAESGSMVEGFYPNVKPSDFLEDVLENNIVADEGDIVKVKYIQYNEEPTVITTTNYSLEENFNYGSVAGELTTISNDWTAHSGTSAVNYITSGLSMDNYPTSSVGGSIEIDGFGSQDVNRSFNAKTSGTIYLSGLVNLTAVGAEDGTYFFHLMDDGTNFRARIGAKSDGDGKILFGIGASSSSLTFTDASYDFNTTYLLVASYNMQSGESNLHVLTSVEASEPAAPAATNTGSTATSIEKVAIRQGWNGPTGSVDGIRVATSWEDLMVNDVATDVQGDKTYTEVYYTFNGTYWNESDGVYYLSSDDYDSMGTASGQPGRYNNFDGNVAPNNYIPAFLALEHPFAQEEDELIVMYRYYSDGSTNVKGNLYTVINGVWTAHSASLQFGHDGSAWVPDNTIKYTLTQADYDSLGTEFGDPGYYNNFDVREGNDNYESPESILAYINIVLSNNFPGMAEGQKFTVLYDVYSGTAEVWEMNVILSGGVYVLQ